MKSSEGFSPSSNKDKREGRSEPYVLSRGLSNRLEEGLQGFMKAETEEYEKSRAEQVSALRDSVAEYNRLFPYPNANPSEEIRESPLISETMPPPPLEIPPAPPETYESVTETRSEPGRNSYIERVSKPEKKRKAVEKPVISEEPRVPSNPILERISGGKRKKQSEKPSALEIQKNKTELAEAIDKQNKHDAEVAQRRESRAEEFAEKFGLTELRNAKIAAEKAAYEEDLKHHKNPLRRAFAPTREGREKARRKADEATLAWSKALANLPEGTSEREKLEALIIRKRDTLITPNALRTQARIDALDERGKTLVGKALNAPGWAAKKALQGMNAASGGIGKGLFHMLGNKKLKGKELEKEQAKYKKAGQIILGATIGSVMGIVAGPGGLAAAAGAIGFSTFRTVLGSTVGMGAGYAAEYVNKHSFDRTTKEDYRKEVRNTEVENVHSLQMQQRAEKHGSRTNRQKRAQNIKIGAAVIGGAATSLELGHFAHLASVQHALHEHPPITPKTGEELRMEIGGKNAEGVNLNDADKLFGHFGLMLQRDFAHVPHTQTPAIDTYLKHLEAHNQHGVNLKFGEDPMSKAFGFEGKGGISEVMHKGDTIMLDTNGRVLINWADGRPYHVLINADGSINHNIDDITAHMKMPHHHVATEHASASETPESAVPKTSSPDGSGNLGAAPEPDSSNVLPEALARARESATFQSLNAHHESIASQHEKLVAAYASHDPNYARLSEQYKQSVADYNKAMDTYNAVHPIDATDSAVKPITTSPETVGDSIASNTTEIVQLDSLKNPPPLIDSLVHTDAWSHYNTFDASKVISTLPHNGGDEAISFRNQLFSIMRESGVGPHNNEQVREYITRATAAIQDNAGKGVSPFDARPAIYEASDHHLQVHGGDLDARLLVAKEFFLKNPTAQVVVENPGGRTPLFVYSPGTINEGYFPPADSKLPPITPNSKLVY